MKYKNGIRINNLLGIQAGHIFEINSLKYCPLCAIDDYKKHKETYFHRLHQVEGIKVCSKHECFLKEYNLKDDVSRLEFICLDYNNVDSNIEYETDDALRKWYVKIAKSYEFLLSNDLYQYNNIKVHEMYIGYLDSLGFLTPSKKIKQIELAEKFTGFYGENLLNQLNCSIDKNNESNWLRNITRKPTNIIHPLRHILFINFLCCLLEDFFQNKASYHPFGNIPWPCLNIAADHYLKDVITNCIITSDYRTRQPVGTFECSCGFIYSRKGPDSKGEDRYKVGRIKQFGHIWEQKLIELINEEKYNLKSLSEKMNCDPKTIVKYAKKLSVIDKINTNMKIKEDSIVSQSENNFNYKDELLNFIMRNPGLNRTEIRNSMKKQYIWLYRHDKEWLMENLPTCMGKVEIDNKSNTRVDWNERDKQICESIRTEYEKIISSGKLVRITKSLLGKRAGCSSLVYKCLDKMSQTNLLLNQVCESVEEYQIRRIELVAEQLYEDEVALKKWEIFKKSGIRKEFESSLLPIIDKIIGSLG